MIITKFEPKGYAQLSNDMSPAAENGTTSAFEIRRFLKSEASEDFACALALRTEVFVVEQNVPPEEEQDDYDEEALHWLFLDGQNGEALATGRMLPYQEVCQSRPVAKIGRVAVKKSRRGEKLGNLLMREILSYVDAEGFDQAILDAQTPVLGFYEKLGFVAEGEEFMDAGIPHYRMRRVVR